jgi:hypothetical protein
MALTKTISATAEERLKILDPGKYKSMNSLVAIAKYLFAEVDVDPTLTFDSAIANPATFLLKVGVFTTGKQYKILKHDEDTYYTVIPGMNSRKFKVLFEDDFGVNTLRGTIAAQSANNFLIGGNAPWFGLPNPDTSRNMTGKAFSNGSVIAIPTDKATAPYSLQWNSVSSGSPPLYLQFRKIQEADGGEGISSLPGLIWEKTKITGINTGHQDCINRPTVSRHIAAYNKTIDMYIDIGYKNDEGSGIEIDKIADALIALEFDYAMFLDGSDSVFLWEYNGPGKGRPFVDDLSFFKNISLDVGFAIKKNQL